MIESILSIDGFLSSISLIVIYLVFQSEKTPINIFHNRREIQLKEKFIESLLNGVLIRPNRKIIFSPFVNNSSLVKRTANVLLNHTSFLPS